MNKDVTASEHGSSPIGQEADVGKELTAPVQLRCAIVDEFYGGSSPCLTYIVVDENKIIVAEGVSSSPEWVRNDAGGYHTKERFDKMFPQGWVVSYDF